MGLQLSQITSLSRDVVREYGRGLDIVSVATGDGGSDRVEVMITIQGCHAGECRFVLNVSRANGTEFDREFTAQLKDALNRHSATQPPG